MAQAIGLSSFPRAIRWLARPSPPVRYGLKLGTAITAAIWIAFATALPWGLTIWITVLFVAQPNAGASIKKGFMRILGTLASALVSIAIYGLFAQQPPLMLASLCGVLALAVYGMTGPRYQYAWLVFGFTTILILVKAMAGSDLIETLSFERSTLTALGVLIVFVADELFWPIRAEEQLRGSLAERSRQLGDTLKQHLEDFSSQQAPGVAGPPPSSPLIQQLGLVDQFRDEIGATPQQVQTLSRIALLLEGLASRVRLLGRDAEREQSFPAQRAPLDRLGESLNAALAEAAHCLAADRAPEPFAEALEHSLAGFEDERMAHLDSLVRQGAPGRGEAERAAPLSALVFVLKDVVQVLGRLEEALLGLVKRDGEPAAERASEAAPGAARMWFRPDPIRLQLGLRAGIAGGGVLVAMLVMGWDLEDDLLPMIMACIVAFILAGVSSTRGAGTTVGIGLASGVLLGWLIADLASVFLFTHLDRMPLSLVYPFVIAGGAGYLIVRGSPLGPLGALFGMLTALLPIFIGDAPPLDVDTAYGLVCGILLGEAAGLIAQRALWPRTAMQIFTQRAAAQLELCLQALGERDTEGGAPVRDAAGLVSDYAKQLTMLGQLHAQAHAEPIERTLDDTRRAELLALLQEIFDASLRTRKWAVGNEAAATQDAAAALAQLREALTRHDEALVASLKSAADALRGSGPAPDSSLGEARAAVDAQIDALRGRADLASALDPGRFGEILAHLAAGRRLVDSQLQLEVWLADWQRAAAAAP